MLIFQAGYGAIEKIEEEIIFQQSQKQKLTYSVMRRHNSGC